MYLKIANNGEIEAQALTLLGASSKRSDNTKIGMFGSGNKYAIAFLLRNKYQLKVFSGIQEITVETKKIEFRDDSFDIIHINGEKTSITTDSGPQWELWKAIREIYSNAIDEGLIKMEMVSGFLPQEGETHFYIEAKPPLIELHDNFSMYFAIDKQVIYSDEIGKIYKKEHNAGIVFRKGIKCGDLESSLFDYDLEKVAITEDRVLLGDIEMKGSVIKMLYTCNNKKTAASVLRNMDSFEAKLWESVYSWNIPNASTLSEIWKESLYGKKICFSMASMFLSVQEFASCVVMSTPMFEAFQSRFGNEIVHPCLIQNGKVSKQFQRVNMNPLQAEILKEVLEFFRECNYDINYPIDVVKFTSAKTHGMAKDGKILLSIDAFTKGKDWVANVIIEEQIHLKYEVKDETRDFQDSAIFELITYMKQKNAHTL